MFINKIYGHAINPNQNLNKSEVSFCMLNSPKKLRSYRFKKNRFGDYTKTDFSSCQHPSSKGSIGEALLDLKTKFKNGDISIVKPKRPIVFKELFHRKKIKHAKPKGTPYCHTFVSKSTGEKVRIIPFPFNDKILVWRRDGEGFLIQQREVVNKALFREVDEMLSKGREYSSADF